MPRQHPMKYCSQRSGTLVPGNVVCPADEIPCHRGRLIEDRKGGEPAVLRVDSAVEQHSYAGFVVVANLPKSWGTDAARRKPRREHACTGGIPQLHSEQRLLAWRVRTKVGESWKHKGLECRAGKAEADQFAPETHVPNERAGRSHGAATGSGEVMQILTRREAVRHGLLSYAHVRSSQSRHDRRQINVQRVPTQRDL